MSPLSVYLSRLDVLRANPQATGELSLRPALDELFQTLKPKNIGFVGEGKKLASGRPDFTFTRAPLHDPIGYVEAEKISADLDALTGHAKTQNERFSKDLDNFLLTNHLDFRLFDGGKPVARVLLPPKPNQISPAHEKDFSALWERFVSAQVATPKTPRELAELLSRRARTLRLAILRALDAPDSPLHRDLEAFRKLLLPDLDAPEFSNLYAETLAYGLFAARCQNPDDVRFSASTADRALRRTPLLRTLYRLFEEKIDANLEWILDDMTAILNGAAIGEIRAFFENRAGRPDPMIDFYEPFLASYDARARKSRGVYYTPEPVVSFIVRSTHALLKSRFGMELGLAGGAKILDPATGTGSFLFAVIDEMHREVGADDWPAFVRDRKPLGNLFGFEILVAPYTVAHLKLALQMEGLHTPLAPEERLNIFLTNTLDDARRHTEAILEGSIADEVNLAADVKEKGHILVVLGNPPYAGHSSNSNTKQMGDERVFTGVGKQVESYSKGVPGLDKPAQAKWLQDDYVKFLAFAQKRIEKSGEGIVAFITNNGYLDNPTFRGMRRSLMQTFSSLYLLDLHGNSKKKEVAPDGSPDKNVFDIQQGVSIILAVKEKGKAGAFGVADVFHADLWGRREEKNEALNADTVETIEWEQLRPNNPLYLFKPRNEELADEYAQCWSVSDIFNRNGDPAPGIVTTQDEFAISFTSDEAKEKVRRLLATTNEAEAREIFRLCSQEQWSYENAKRELPTQDWERKVVPILYRPFDVRFTVYNSHVAVHRRDRVHKHMIGANIGLCTDKQVNGTFRHVLCSNYIINDCTVSNLTKERSYLFPLYLYSEGLFGSEKRANISDGFAAALAGVVGSESVPEDVFGYIYAVLHCPTYRERYGAFLKTDFPRVPLPLSPASFRELATLGSELVALHTLDSSRAPVLLSKRHALSGGSDLVERVRYDGTSRRLHINDAQSFSDVDAETAAFKIGGYVVAEKWLSDRKGRTLSFEERRAFPQILIALDETRRLMAEIDALWANEREMG